MSEELKRDEILSAGPADGDWTDVLKRAKRTHRRQVSAAVVLTALVVVGAASAYALTHRGQPWCKEPASNAWNKVLVSHVVALSRRAAVTPLAVADDGHSFYAVLDSSRYSGIVKIDAGTSRYKEIQRISRPSMFKAEGTANGRWFVWADMWRDFPTDPDYPKWEVWSWDSETGHLREIASEPNAGIHGDWLAGGFSVRDGYMVWVRASASRDPNSFDQNTLHVVDLSSGRDRVVSRGAAFSQPFLLPGHVVVSGRLTVNMSLAKSILTGKATRRMAAKIKTFEPIVEDAITGERAAFPKSMRGLEGRTAAAIVTDGGALAYVKSVKPSVESLWWSPSLATRAWRVFTLPRNVEVNSLQLAGRYVYFGTEIFNNRTGAAQSNGYLVDATTRGYVRVSTNPGAVLLGRSALVMKTPAIQKLPDATKAARAITDVIFLPSKSLPPIRSCPAPVTATG